ncbi:hypothetical protein AQAU111925_13425 [Aquirufa aurantiipilula]
MKISFFTIIINILKNYAYLQIAIFLLLINII